MDVLIVACPVPKVLQERLASGAYIAGDEGLEKLCKKCGEYWPADSEFFYAARSMADGLDSNCKACRNDSKRPGGQRSKTTERKNEMNQTTQTPAPAVAPSTTGWMARFMAALACNQKPEYDDLEEGVHELLAQAAAARRAAGLVAPPVAKTFVVGDKNFAWAQNIDEALAAEKAPAYADLEAGLHHLLEENAVLQQCMKDTQALIARMVVARHGGDTARLLADLDAFIVKFVTITEPAAAQKPQ